VRRRKAVARRRTIKARRACLELQRWRGHPRRGPARPRAAPPEGRRGRARRCASPLNAAGAAKIRQRSTASGQLPLRRRELEPASSRQEAYNRRASRLNGVGGD
jgi:hypothetical protein